MACEFIGKCPIPGARDKECWREEAAKKFCDLDNNDCERYKIRKDKGMEAVPKNLHPDGSYMEKSVFEIGES